MANWKISRTDEARPGELSSVSVCAASEQEALSVVCGGPSSDYPNVSFFDTPPLPGFPSDRSMVKIEEET